MDFSGGACCDWPSVVLNELDDDGDEPVEIISNQCSRGGYCAKEVSEP